tara:strand:- start:2394 stop:3020 length:627 start_codon:yes stop_codon:yes gene_type:complete
MYISYKKKIIQDLNFQNLLTVSKIFSDIEHFVCYGTLLGLTRNKKIIYGDDDVDLLINYKFKKKALRKMNMHENFILNKKVCNKYFAQFINKKNEFLTYIDFYFYTDKSNQDFIIEKHNFLSNPGDPNFSIHFPKKIIFPIKREGSFKSICIPSKPKNLCKFLYGDDWKKPLKKNISYRMEIVNNKPLLIKRSFLGSITRWFKNKLSI